MEGWISIHRKIKDTSWYNDSEYVHLWLHLLLSANYKDNDVKIGNEIIHLKRGQLLTSRKSLERDVHIQESKIYRILKCFESEHQIEQYKTKKYTVITILNYNAYQKNEQLNDCLENNGRTTNEQSMNTNNKYNNLYYFLLNKYKENLPVNWLDKIHKINAIRKMNEYQLLDNKTQNDLLLELQTMKITRY